jgi:hypothetical protein
VDIEIANTPDNASYAASVNARIDAETAKVRWANRLVAAKAGLWHAAGYGMVILAIGAAIGLAFFGYSYISDKRASLDQLTAAFAKALQASTLHTDGNVGIKPGATVALADGGHVALDPGSVTVAPGGLVSLQPDAVSLASASMRDIARKLQQDAAASDKSGRPAPTFDEVTAFHETDFGKGEVVSGWKYHSSDNFAAPYDQYCYYGETEKHNNLQRNLQLASNGQLADNLVNPFDIDVHEAFKLCAWYIDTSNRPNPNSRVTSRR